ncbi:hypothetical protein JCM17846_05500 [Iodidimonas nitroreducens]|uniref:histidine kinase n=1 Tax=Iodidimonas nitroreducens TaxID=1236968 RepID=A0A5A7N409_9PROT|nr:putative sensor-like histidine kinase [alpha proteobacterium Q-1]GER02868.1 hypothetical protein JCM17846_05500 [Iodidimonas nitroreducens]
MSYADESTHDVLTSQLKNKDPLPHLQSKKPFAFRILHKIFLGYVLGTISFIWLSYATFNGVNELARITEDVHRHPFIVSNATAALRTDISETRLCLIGITEAESQTILEAKIQSLHQAESRMMENVALIQERYLGPREDSLLLNKIFDDLQKNNQSVIEAAIAGDDKISREILDGSAEQSILMLAQKVDVIHTFARNMSQNLLQKAKEKERDVQRQMLLAIILGGSIMAFAGFILNSSITRPLYRLRSYMATLIEGDTKNKIPEQDRRDEIGDMARALEVCRNALENREQVEKARHDAEERAHLAEKNRLKDQQEANFAAMALLEKRVEDHTRDLAESNKALIAEIEQRKEVELALKKALRDVELASAAKSNFLAHMSHELRTPLNAILGFTELLKTKSKSENNTDIINEYTDHIGTAGHDLLEMVDTILTLTNEGEKNPKIKADGDCVTVQDLVDAAMTAHAEDAKEKSIEIETDLTEPNSPLLIDKEMLNKALSNLLSNAIKFSPKSSPVLISGGPEKQHYAIRIIDRGIGISPDHFHSIMEPFSQTENPLIRSYEGAGLGLPHARRIIENNGGSIAIDSNLGEGTIVTITLPLATDT